MAFSSSKTIVVEYLTLTPDVYAYHAKNGSTLNYYYSTLPVTNPLKDAAKIPSMHDGKINLYPGTTRRLYIYDHYGKLIYNSEIDPSNSKTVDAGRCLHVWKEYVGFTESYSFCVLCDAKKEA